MKMKYMSCCSRSSVPVFACRMECDTWADLPVHVTSHHKSTWTFDSSDRKFSNSLTLVEILKSRKPNDWGHINWQTSFQNVRGKKRTTKRHLANSCYQLCCFYLPKALKRATISCLVSWNGSWAPGDLGRLSICRPEKRIFSAVPRPWVWRKTGR